MKLELEELESFNVGEVVSKREAYRLAKESGRRVLSSRWVNTVKKPGLYRSRLVVRDFAAMGGTTLAEGIYSPTTSLEGLRLLLSVLCRKGSVLSCDVSVAFMHAATARPEFVQLPSNIGNAKTGERVFLKLFRAMNGLRSAPLSWYKELSAYLGNQGFQQILDPTIFRKKTRNGLVIVLFYVDDLLIWAENPAQRSNQKHSCRTGACRIPCQTSGTSPLFSSFRHSEGVLLRRPGHTRADSARG